MDDKSVYFFSYSYALYQGSADCTVENSSRKKHTNSNASNSTQMFFLVASSTLEPCRLYRDGQRVEAIDKEIIDANSLRVLLFIFNVWLTRWETESATSCYESEIIINRKASS